MSAEAPPLADEDQARANLYALLARLFAAPPDGPLLQAIAGSDEMVTEGEADALARAWADLVAASAVMDPEAAAHEYDGLFVGVGKSEVNLHASHHVAGFMMEKPLAALRSRLAALGLAARPDQSTLEDHLAALCETMRILVAGTPRRTPAALSEQQAFFDAEIAPWYERCLAELCAHPLANFYRKVGQFAVVFLSLEQKAFRIG